MPMRDLLTVADLLVTFLENYYIKFGTLVMHSVRRKSGTFHYIK